jgi:AcrR family transcriptional regulator
MNSDQYIHWSLVVNAPWVRYTWGMNNELSPRDAGITIPDQIVEAADAHFSRYGYAKTTMADLANAIGFSKSYLYKFFDSKQAIGEAICGRCLGKQLVAIQAAVDEAKTAQEKLRALLKTAVAQHLEQFFSDRQLYDIVTHSVAENWRSSREHGLHLLELLKSIIVLGRQAGEFERKTPLDELANAIWLASSPFLSPVLLQYNLDRVEAGVPSVTNLILRSLAP